MATSTRLDPWFRAIASRRCCRTARPPCAGRTGPSGRRDTSSGPFTLAKKSRQAEKRASSSRPGGRSSEENTILYIASPRPSRRRTGNCGRRFQSPRFHRVATLTPLVAVRCRALRDTSVAKIAGHRTVTNIAVGTVRTQRCTVAATSTDRPKIAPKYQKLKTEHWTARAHPQVEFVGERPSESGKAAARWRKAPGACASRAVGEAHAGHAPVAPASNLMCEMRFLECVQMPEKMARSDPRPRSGYRRCW
jgi:hypothetical protein